MNLTYASQLASLILRPAPLLALALLAGPMQSVAQGAVNTEVQNKNLADRKDIIDAILNHDSADSVADQRSACAMGGEPASVRESRVNVGFFPDASDSCIAALTRTARDGNLSQLYATIVTEQGGNMDGYKELPNVIGGAALHGKTDAPIGNNKAIVVKPALAFDAGFTLAYQKAAPDKGNTNTAKLKALTEDCLDQKQDPGNCFSLGYVSGAIAYAKANGSR